MAVSPADVAALGRMFAAVDAIDEHIGDPPRRPFPCRGVVTCPTCGTRLVYVQLTPIKGAGRCETPGCVDFAPVAPVKV
jgi:hypothetical protein